MALFKKKPPCPICGGKIEWLLPSKIDDEYVCGTCYGKLDVEQSVQNNLTMQEFRDYLAFFEENKQLRDSFNISETIDFGFFDTKIIFDYDKNLFCMSKKPDKTIFTGENLKSIVIKEDAIPIFEVSQKGVMRFITDTPQRATLMYAQVQQLVAHHENLKEIARLKKESDPNSNTYVPVLNLPKPVGAFNVEITLNHPYWSVIKCDMDAPSFSESFPSINDYTKRYNEDLENMEKLAISFAKLAFPGAVMQTVGGGIQGFSHSNVQTVQGSSDPIGEIKKYKELFENDIITKEEFEAKKKQLMGI